MWNKDCMSYVLKKNLPTLLLIRGTIWLKMQIYDWREIRKRAYITIWIPALYGWPLDYQFHMHIIKQSLRSSSCYRVHPLQKECQHKLSAKEMENNCKIFVFIYVSQSDLGKKGTGKYVYINIHIWWGGLQEHYCLSLGSY